MLLPRADPDNDTSEQGNNALPQHGVKSRKHTAERTDGCAGNYTGFMCLLFWHVCSVSGLIIDLL